MEIVLLLTAGALVVGLAVGLAIAVWRLTGPGKRLRFGAINLFYTQAVTLDEANRVGRHLMREKFTDTEMDARLTREGNTYQLQLICSHGQADERQDIACEMLAAGLSDDVFAGAAVEVHVCDTVLRPTSVIVHRGRFGRRIAMNAAHLFYLDGVTDAAALDVATFLAGVGVFDDAPKIAQMNRSGEGYEFRLAVEVDPLEPPMVEGARQMARDLSGVLRGAAVAVHFCRGLLGTLRVREGPADTHVSGGPYRTEIYGVPDPLPRTDLDNEDNAKR